MTEEEVKRWVEQAEPPARERWQLRYECLWIMQPEGGYAETRAAARRRPAKQAEEQEGEKLGERAGGPGNHIRMGWDGYVATIDTRQKYIYLHDPQHPPYPVDAVIGVRPILPPTGLGNMGWMEESNPFITRLVYRIDTHPEEFRLEGTRRIRGFGCVGFSNFQRLPEPEGAFTKDVFWVAPAAGCTPLENVYEWGREGRHLRSVSHVLDLREVAPGRWMPFLCGTVDGIVVKGPKPRHGPRATLVEVVEFQWGYRPSPEEVTVTLDGEVRVRFGVRPLLRLDGLRLAPSDLPSLAARFGPPPAMPPPPQGPYLVLAAGALLFLLAVLSIGYFARRLRRADPLNASGRDP